MKPAIPLTLLLSMSGLAFAHGGEKHLKGEVTAIDDKQLTLTTEEKETVTVAFDKATQFDNDGKASAAKDLAPGSRAVVHLRPGSKAPTAALVKFSAAAGARLDVTVTPDGFIVAKPRTLKAGQPVTLVVTRTTDKTCAKDIVLKEFGISKALPLNQTVEVTFVPKKAGKVHFACAMDMVGGDLQVE